MRLLLCVNKSSSSLPKRLTDESAKQPAAENFVIFPEEGRDYPHFYYNQKPNQVDFGYGPKNSSDLSAEFLKISYSQKSHKLTITTDVFRNWPLFYYADQNHFILASSLNELAVLANTKKIALQPNFSEIAVLLSNVKMGLETLIDGVNLLPSSSRIIWESGQLKISKSQKLPTIPQQSQSVDFKIAIEQTASQYYQKLSDQNLTLECSGGIDSSYLPLFLNHKYNLSLATATMLFDGDLKDSQSAKIQDIQSVTNSESYQIEIDQKQHFPLARFRDNSAAIFYQFEEIYFEALDQLAKIVSQKGSDAVSTGIGGDELFENRDVDVSSDEKNPLEDCLNPPFFKKYNYKKTSFPTIMANSAFFANQSRNSIYTQNNIWPVSPLSDPKLYHFCQKLPATSKYKKNIFRLLYEAYGWPESIYKPPINENFGGFFERSVRTNYPEWMSEIITEDSYLNKLKIINLANVQKRYQKPADQISPSELFFFFRLMIVEINLRGLFNLRQSKSKST